MASSTSSSRRGRSQRQRSRNRNPGKPTAKAPGEKPSKGSGASALAVIRGAWSGVKGETYTVMPSWACEIEDKKGKREYDLAWDADNQLIMWGSTYMMDPYGVNEDTEEISWYRQ